MTSRRRFLVAAGLTAGATGLAAGSATTTSAKQGTGSASSTKNPAFEGTYQSGIIDEPRAASTVAALDVTAENRYELQELFCTVTERARSLTSGDLFDPTANGVIETPTDSGTLGPGPGPDSLSITLGVGASLFDRRFGLKPKRPHRLIEMDTFAGDRLEPDKCGGDLSLVISANGRDTVLHALRDILRHTRGGMQVRWKQDGFTSAPRPSGTPRNHFGFKDGISNPTTSELTKLVWAHDHDQRWTANGTYQAVRLIRMFTEFWDRIGITEQNNIFGRDRATGAPLDGNRETDQPSFAMDPKGSVIPLTSHMRLANPRTAETDGQRILRRSFNYESGLSANGDLDVGLVFVCYQADITKQFATIQRRLSEDPLNDYISHIGGGYFLALPGVRGSSDYLGQDLFV